MQQSDTILHDLENITGNVLIYVFIICTDCNIFHNLPSVTLNTFLMVEAGTYAAL